jgi:protein-arginine kinase activator protein McsA
VNGENESMEEVDMDGSESDHELTGFCNSSRTANPRSERNSNLEYCDTCNKPFSLFRLSAIVCVHCADIRILFSESITTPVLLCRERL